MKQKTIKPINRFLRIRCFLLAFLSTMVLLGLIATPMLAASESPETVHTAVYEPDYADRLHLLCAVRDSDSGHYLRFYLLELQPFDAQIYLAPLPPQLIVTAGDRQNSLEGFASYGGIALCAEALEQSYRLLIDRTVTVTTLQLRDWVNRLESIRFTLSKETRCEKPDGSAGTVYRAGNHTLDGAAFVELLTQARYDTQLEGQLLSGKLLVGWINQVLTPRADPQSNPMTEWIGYMTTDISYADYLSRADALDHIALQQSAAKLLPIGGAFSYGDRRFVLSEESVATLRQHFGGSADGKSR